LSLTPYRVEEKGGNDVTINCRHNITESDGGRIIIKHVNKDTGRSKVVYHGKLVTKMANGKYEVLAHHVGEGIRHNIVTLKSTTQ